MNLDQQIADVERQIMMYGMPDMYGVDAEIANAGDYAKGLANHLVRNRPDVNAQLLEAAKELIEKTNAFLSQWTGMPAPRGYMDLRKEEADLHAAVTQAERGDGVVE